MVLQSQDKPVRGGERFLRAVFEPLGYAVEATRYPLDEQFPDWGDSPYFAVTVQKTTALADLLTHLYVLIPVFDNRKHYWVGDNSGQFADPTGPSASELQWAFFKAHPFRDSQPPSVSIASATATVFVPGWR